jgi:protein TonB
MVLTQRHPHHHATALSDAIARIQPVRVLGLAGAIALNVAALMLLLVPVSAPMQTSKQEVVEYWLPSEKKAPPPEPKPIEVPVIRPQTQPHTRVPVTQPQPQPQPVNQDVVVPDGSEYVPPQNNTATDPLPPFNPNPDPLPSTRLEYAAAPAPSYPREALLDGIEGTVLLRVLVDVNGKPLSVEIERSSGNRRLDDAARRQVLRKWTFKPAIRDGQAVQVYGLVPVSFSLTRQ